MFTVTYTKGDLTKMSNGKFVVKHDQAIVRDIDEAKQAIISICRGLKLKPQDFLITKPCGGTTRLQPRFPDAWK